MDRQRASVRQVNDDRMGPQADRQGLLRVLGSAGVPVPAVQAELAVAVGPDLLLPLDLKRPLLKSSTFMYLTAVFRLSLSRPAISWGPSPCR